MRVIVSRIAAGIRKLKLQARKTALFGGILSLSGELRSADLQSADALRATERQYWRIGKTDVPGREEEF